jgi:hypothetical protein
MKVIPKLPSFLAQFKLAACGTLTQIPALPDSIQKFEIIQCEKVEDLPPLPESLRDFSCENFHGKTLPDFPAKLRKLNLNQLKNVIHLPEFHEGLRSIHCTWCPKLQKFGPLPLTLDEFNLEGCDSLEYSSLLSLSVLTNLKTLKLSSIPSLTTLPALPNNLEELDVSYCLKLFSIGENKNLPASLKKLICKGSGLMEISNLPPHLRTLDLSQSFFLMTISDLPHILANWI